MTKRRLSDCAKCPCSATCCTASEEDALSAPRGSISLVFCPRSALIHNADFDPALMAYDVEYENALHHSERFQKYAQSLACSLVDRHGLRDKRVLEIGCGDGHFLGLLSRAGNNHAVGYDPSPERDGTGRRRPPTT